MGKIWQKRGKIAPPQIFFLINEYGGKGQNQAKGREKGKKKLLQREKLKMQKKEEQKKKKKKGEARGGEKRGDEDKFLSKKKRNVKFWSFNVVFFLL